MSHASHESSYDAGIRAVAESIPHLFWISSPDGNTEYVNERWVQYTGLSLKRTRSLEWMQVLHPDDLERCQVAWSCAVEKGARYEIEYRIKRERDGVYRWFLVGALPLRDDHGKVSKWFGTLTDIDDQKQLTAANIEMAAQQKASAVIHESEAKFRSVFDKAPLGIALVDPDGTWVQVNATICRMLGYTAAEMRKMKFGDITHPEDRAKSEQASTHLKAGTIDVVDLEKRYLDKNGHVIWARVYVSALRDEQGRVTHFVTQMLDITEPKRINDELFQSKTFLNTVLDNLPVALFCKDGAQGFRFSLWNKMATETWGLTADAILGKSDYDFFPSDQADLFRQKDTEVLEKGVALEILEEEITTPTKGHLILHTKKVPVAGADGKPRFLLGISEDISEKKRAEKLIEDQKVRLVSAEKMTSLGEMAAGIAHEINNPLAIIAGGLEQMEAALNGKVIDIARLNRLFTVLNRTVDRISKIVSGLQVFARDGSKDSFGETSIASIIEGTLAFCQERNKQHGIDLELEPIPETLVAWCQPTQISQIFLNLINNAHDAILPLEEKWIRIRTRDLGAEIEIVVEDSGNGIPEAVAGKMFEPFFTTKEVGKGTGLGLSISKGIVESHHGSLVLDRSSKNTRFVVVLPKGPQSGKSYDSTVSVDRRR